MGIYPCAETVIPQLILLAITIFTFVYWLRKNKKLVTEAKEANEKEAKEKKTV